MTTTPSINDSPTVIREKLGIQKGGPGSGPHPGSGGADKPSEKYGLPNPMSSMANKEKSKSISGLAFRAKYMSKLADDLKKEPTIREADKKSVLDRLKTLKNDIDKKYNTSQERYYVSDASRHKGSGSFKGGDVKSQATGLSRTVDSAISDLEGGK